MGYEILKVCFHQQNSQEMIGDVQILENGAENQYLKTVSYTHLIQSLIELLLLKSIQELHVLQH